MVGPVAGYTPTYNFAKVRYDVVGWSSLEHGNWTQLDALLSLIAGLPGVRGVWALSTSYLVGDRVVDGILGGVYRCLVAHTSAASGTFEADRIANPTYWEIIATVPVFTGDWTTATAYSSSDIVAVDTYDYYYCLVAHTSGVFATDLAAGKWTLIWQGTATVDAAEAAQLAAEAAQLAAENAKTAAELAETNAETAETNAETAETNAEAAQVAAAASASTATTQAGIATTQAGNAATSAATATTQAGIATTQAGNAAASAASAATIYDNFDDRYLGAKAAAPTLDNDGNALLVGAIYFLTTGSVGMYVWDGANWSPIGSGGGMFKGDNGTVGSRAGDIFRVTEQQLDVSTTIAATENAHAPGPLTVATGVTLTVSSGGNLVIT